MIDRFGKEVDFSELFMEETLSAKDKKTIPDDQWGLIIKNDKGEIVERKFPLNDETHVRQAAIFFDRAKGLSDDQKRELARNIVRRAKELDMDYSGWESLKPYLDKPVKESYYDPDPDSTSGTSDFDDNDLDDEYYGEADQALMNQIQTNEDKIPILQLRTYAKKCLHEGKSYNGGDKAYIFECIKNDANNQDKRCHEYFFNLIKEIDKCVGDQDLRKIENRPQKWFRYEKLINKFFSSIGVRYGKDRVVTSINLRAHSLTFLEKEFVKFRYDPTTDILIHRSRRNNLLFLKPSHAAGDGPIYPKPRIYFTLEPRSRYTVKGAYGDYAYEPNINKPIDVLYDTESPSHASINVSSDKYGKNVFINTYKPLAVKQITSDNIQEGFSESFEEMFDPVIQEAFDAVTGKEIPINRAYTMEEMAKRSLSLDEAKAMEKDGLIPIKPPKTDEVYFGSPTNHMPEIDLNRPLFVSPYKGIASIFIWGDMGLQNRIPRGSYNHNYEEWINFDEKKMKNPLKEVHVYVEGAPFLEPFTVEQEGYIHCISTKDYLNNFFRKPWMTKDLEYLIAKTDNMKVEFTRSIKCKVKYYIKGRPSPKGKSYGPSKGGILQYIHDIADKIHAKYKADQKEPTGNQNCLLCAWCAEASIRGGEYLPRPVYSPRDPALEIVPGDIVGGVTKKNTGNFHDMLAHLRKDSIGQPFARWYCHVKWGHSNGGHEFLIVKIDEDAFNIMDPQQGIVRPLTADDSYMKEVDWEETYICRIDDKPFKYMKLDQINDPKKTLPWDPKKDIPYMVKHGMCTKEEAEKELKKAETNLFTSELKKALNQSHIQESAWNDIRNGVNPWSDKLVFHISPQGHLDGQVFNPRVPEYLAPNKPGETRFEDTDNPRVCFSTSIEGCLNAILVNIARWKTANKLGDWYVYVPEKPLKEYKHSTNKALIKDKKVFDANVTKEIWIEEPVRLKQYGVIRIDQVHDRTRKKTVPNAEGNSDSRSRYSFKWHWLVRPSVIKDLPYDYSPIAVCNNMEDDISGFKYGLGYDGSIHHGSSKDFDEKYRLESPEEFEKNGGGICYDFVEWQAGYLEAYGYTCRKFYISTETKDKVTHTFILVDDGKGGFIYPEAAFEPMKGVHKVKYPEEAVRMIIERFFKICDDETIKYYVWEYSGHPPYGSTMKECTEYFTEGEPFMEGSMNKPEKIKRKD